MRNVTAASLVFLGGFAIMVLEIIGARFLAKDFGGSFYVWVSQIGVILIALALGYWVGGALADRFQRISFLVYLLAPAGLATVFIPDFAGPLLDAIIQRHPADREIPLVWQKLDPALGSALIFLLPCFALATLPPYMIRLATQRLAHVAAQPIAGTLRIHGVFSHALVVEHAAHQRPDDRPGRRQHAAGVST